MSDCDLEQVDPAALTTILEEIENEHGRFRAYRDGKIRVVFTDRTILQFAYNRDLCKFVFPNGSEGTTTLAAAPVRQRMYIHRALDFGDWAFASLDERMERFQRQQRTQEITMHELHRIRVRCEMNSDTDPSPLANKVHSNAEGNTDDVPFSSAAPPDLLNQIRNETLKHIATVDQALRAANALAATDKL